jgi:hypothetical protein
MDLGCFTNCLPAFIPLRLAALVAAISARLNPLDALTQGGLGVNPCAVYSGLYEQDLRLP